MRDRQTTLYWMKDLIEHLRQCHEQLQWTENGPAESFLTDAMVADLSECRKLCERLRAGQFRGETAKGSATRGAMAVTAKG